MKILVPIDGSALSLDALRHALALIRQGLRADLVLANVQAPASLYEIVVAHDPQVIQDVSAGAGAHLLEPARQLCRDAGVAFDCEVVSGDTVNALCDLAERRGCAQIVIGDHGRGVLASALLGSVSHALAHAAPVPVTIVKPADAARRVAGAWTADAATVAGSQPAQHRPADS